MIIIISGIIKSTRKTSTTALKPQHLKVKYIEWDISQIKNYCITISLQKISSIHQCNLEIQQILGSHELKGHAYPKIIETTFSFPEFVASCKKSIYSNCSFLRYIQF